MIPIPRKTQVAIRALLLVLCAAAVLIGGCSDDSGTCPTCPEPEPIVDEVYDGRLYVTMAFGNMGLFVFDLATDSLIDSVMYFTSMGEVDVTPDGKYIAAEGLSETLIFNASDMSQVCRIGDLATAGFIENGTALLGIYRDVFYRYSVPEFELQWSEQLSGWGDYVYLDASDEFFGIARWDTLYCYSFQTHSVRRTWLLSSESGDTYLMRMDVNSTGTRCYGIAVEHSHVNFFILDLESDSVISRFPLYTNAANVKLNPQEDEVYVADPGAVGYTLSPGTIYVFDAETGEYLEGISLYGYNQDMPDTPLDPYKMEFSPDGSQLFVRTGDIGTEFGTVLRINTRTKTVEKLMFPEIDRLADDLAVGPKP